MWDEYNVDNESVSILLHLHLEYYTIQWLMYVWWLCCLSFPFFLRLLMSRIVWLFTWPTILNTLTIQIHWLLIKWCEVGTETASLLPFRLTMIKPSIDQIVHHIHWNYYNIKASNLSLVTRWDHFYWIKSV